MPRPNLAELDPPSLRRSPKMLDISSFDLDPAVPRPTRDRADNLVASLKRATALVERTVHDTTPFATLSLALFGKVVHELDHVVQLVEAAAAVEATGERDSLPVRVEESRPTRRSSKVHEPVGHKREIGHEEQGEEQGEERASRPPRHEGESNEHDQPRRREGRPRDEQRDEPVVAVDQPRDRRDALERLSHDGRVHRPSSSHARRDEAPPHNRARVDRVPSRPASATPASPISSPVDEPADKRRSISRAASRLTSRVVSPPPPSAPPHDEPGPPARRHIDRKATRSAAQTQPCSSSPDPSAIRRRESSSARPKSRASSAAPRRDDYEPRDLRSSPLDGPATRPKSRTSTSTASSRRAPTLEPLPPRRSSSRSRFVADSSASDDDELVRRRTHVDEGDEPASQPRSRSKARLAARSSSGRSDDARRALELASAPPPRAMGSDSDDEGQARRPSSAAPAVRPAVLTGARVAAAVVRAVEGGPGGGKQELATLSLVSSEYREPSQAALYRVVAVTSTRQLDLFLRTIESAPSLGALVRELKIQPLDADLPTPQPEPLIDPLRRLLNRLPNLTSLDEDFTAGDWDVGDLSTGRDYLLTVLSPCNLVRFRSAKAWFEIGALFALLQTQPQLVELVIGGAAMDRDWVGTKLLATLASSSSSPAPAALLESIEIGQVMHEDTLAVLLRATGGDSVGRLSSVRIGFQSLGASDDDTPLASVPAALALVGSTVTHLALAAPRKASDDSSALLDEVVAVLPRLEVLEWTEATDLAPLALAKPTVLVRLPSSLRVLRARSLVSLSTSAVLSFLHGDAPRALEVLDVQWAHGSSTAEDLAKEPWFKPRHIARIEDAAAELGIECRVGKGDEALAFGRA